MTTAHTVSIGDSEITLDTVMEGDSDDTFFLKFSLWEFILLVTVVAVVLMSVCVVFTIACCCCIYIQRTRHRRGN